MAPLKGDGDALSKLSELRLDLLPVSSVSYLGK